MLVLVVERIVRLHAFCKKTQKKAIFKPRVYITAAHLKFLTENNPILDFTVFDEVL
jgi:phage-related protein